MEEAQDLARAHGLVGLSLSHLECCLAVLKAFPASSRHAMSNIS